MQCSSLLHSIPFLPEDSRDLMVQWDIAIPSNSHSESALENAQKREKYKEGKEWVCMPVSTLLWTVCCC